MTMKYLQRKNDILRCTSFGYSMKMSETSLSTKKKYGSVPEIIAIAIKPSMKCAKQISRRKMNTWSAQI